MRKCIMLVLATLCTVVLVSCNNIDSSPNTAIANPRQEYNDVKPIRFAYSCIDNDGVYPNKNFSSEYAVVDCLQQLKDLFPTEDLDEDSLLRYKSFLNDYTNRYNDEWFEENQLVIIVTGEKNAQLNRKVTGLSDDGVHFIDITTVVNGDGNVSSNLTSSFIFVEINQKVFSERDEISIRYTDYVHAETKNNEEVDKH